MSHRLTLETGPHGEARLRKRAADESEAERIRHEAEVLMRFAGPGVVELAGVSDSGGLPALLLVPVEGHSLSSTPAGDLESAVDIVRGVAATVARLHAAGLVHRAVRAEHVLVPADGPPILCGFGASADRQALGDDFDQARAGDIADLGALLDDVASAEGDPVLRQAVRRVAARCADPDPAERPDADGLRLALDAVRAGGRRSEPMSTPPAKPPPSRPEHRRRAGRISIRGLAGGVAAVGIVGLVAVSSGGDDPVDESARPATPSASVAPATAPTTAAGGARIWPTTCPVDGPPGCPVVRNDDGRRLLVEGHWFEAADGELLVSGDFDCDGSLDVVAIRTTTGSVFLFDRWPTAGQDETAGVAHRLPPARTADLEPHDVSTSDADGDGCDELLLTGEGRAADAIHLGGTS